ncbi:SDR family NAD(P)-dependent oxidoreductase [Thermodesulfobacteriota bacterium]
MFDLSGKTTLITGSSRGIGKAIAEQMSLFGANVVISSRKADACQKVADEINNNAKDGSGKAVAIPCNITHMEDLENLVRGTLDHFGQIDILVCNAAVNVYFGPMVGISEEAFDKTMHANIKSNVWLCRMILPGMAERRDGVIIVISSIGGLSGSDILGTYSITKAADIALIRNIAVEYGPKNIRANAIAPGLIRTDFSRALWENEEILEDRVARAPLRRIGEPNEIAGATVFLASGAGTFITGQTIAIDGGVTA